MKEAATYTSETNRDCLERRANGWRFSSILCDPKSRWKCPKLGGRLVRRKVLQARQIIKVIRRCLRSIILEHEENYLASHFNGSEFELALKSHLRSFAQVVSYLE